MKECNFTYVRPAVWNKPTNSTTFTNADCDEWSNDPYVLCFNCQSCKDGFLQDINRIWKRVAIVNIIVIVSLLVLFWFCHCGPDPKHEE